MIRSTMWKVLGGALCAALFAASSANAQSTAGATVSVAGTGDAVRAAGAVVTITGDISTAEVAGAKVDISATSTGGIKAAAAQITFTGKSGGDLDTFGATVNVSGRIDKDVHVGGATVDVSASVGGSLMGGGATFTLSPLAEVGGDLGAGGAVVTIGGHIAGKVDVGGARVYFNAKADGPVQLTGETVVIGPNAKIGGTLTVRSPKDPEVDPAASLTGDIVRAPMPHWPDVPDFIWSIGLAVAIAIGTVVAGIVLLLFGGRLFSAAIGEVRHRPLSSFLIGIVTLILVPVIAVLLMVTVVGISVGFAVLFILPILIIFGHAVAAAGIASGLLLRRPGEVGAILALVMLIIGAAILAALGFIPIAGPLIVALALAVGLGAFARTLGRRLRTPAPAM